MTDVTDKVERAIARFERVTRQLDERDGPVRDAARRERQRLNADLRRRVKRVGVRDRSDQHHHHRRRLRHADRHVRLPRRGRPRDRHRRACSPSRPSAETRSAAAPSTDLPNGEMVQRFDSYLYRTRRALPAPAQAEIDAHQRRIARAPADARTRRDTRSRRAGRAAPDVDPSPRPDRPLPARARRLTAPSRTAKARRSTSG